MGATFRFTCPGCGYTADVDGGKGLGKRSAKMTIICKNCKELSNIRLSEPPKVVSDRLWKPPKKNCPKCHSDQTSFWQHPGECPKCGKIMEKGQKVAMWD